MTVDRIEILRIAAQAECDPRSVRRELREPGSVRGLAGDRIRRVIGARAAPPPSTSRDVEHGGHAA